MKATEQRWALFILASSLAAGAVLRFWLAVTDDGLFFPDEIYQSLEPGHRAAFGYGLVAWEFIDGARNWTFPGAMAGVLKLASWVGLDSPRSYVTAVRALFCAIGVATGIAVFRLARACGARHIAAAWASALFSLMGLAIYFAPRAMSETASALAVAFGLAGALPSDSSRRQLWIGTSLLGLSVLLRLQCALFCAAFLIVLISRRAYRSAVQALCVLLGWAFLYGLLDKLTWGSWFHSAITYLRFNWVEHGAKVFGTSPPSFYTAKLLSSLGPLWAVLVVVALAGALRSPGLWMIAAFFWVPHWLTEHKEIRFMFPILPILCALAGIGVEVLRERGRAWLWMPAICLGAAAAVYSAATFKQLTFEKLGVPVLGKGIHSAFDAGGSENRLLSRSHAARDLCGLKITSRDLPYVGGFTYLHRRVPLYGPSGPPESSRRFNYVIGTSDVAAGSVVAADGGLVLARIFNGKCESDPSYTWKLE